MKAIQMVVLALALVIPIGCKSSSGGAGVVTPKMVTVEILDFSFNPKSIQINSGDTVRWVLVGTNPAHTVTALNQTFDSGLVFLQPGDTFDVTFNQNNLTFEYSCQSHTTCCTIGQTADMKGSVLVGSGAPTPMVGY